MRQPHLDGIREQHDRPVLHHAVASRAVPQQVPATTEVERSAAEPSHTVQQAAPSLFSRRPAPSIATFLDADRMDGRDGMTCFDVPSEQPGGEANVERLLAAAAKDDARLGAQRHPALVQVELADHRQLQPRHDALLRTKAFFEEAVLRKEIMETDRDE